MAESTLADPKSTNDYDDCCLSIPPLDPTSPDPYPITTEEEGNDVVFDDIIDFDFSFDDDLYLPSIDDDHDDNTLPVSLDPTHYSTRPELFSPNIFQPDHHNHNGFETPSSLNAFKTTSPEFPHAEAPDNFKVLNSSPPREICRNSSGDDVVVQYLNVPSPESNGSKNRSSEVRVLNLSSSPEPEICHNSSGNGVVAGYLNVLSPESNGSNDGSSEARVLNCSSPAESQDSGSNNLSEANYAKSSVNSSPNFDINAIKNGFVDEKINLESYVLHIENNSNNTNTNSDSNENCLLKRKKDGEDSNNSSDNVESRTNKYRKSSNNNSDGGGENGNLTTEVEEKKRNVRLVRNRESAQLSRQRKKHYVEELEDKVRMMHSTIQDLNSKVSYIMSENVGLRQQLGGGAVPPPMGPPPGMYPPLPMMYQWMPTPPYMVNPRGSQVPLVPIPRLKPQQVVSAPKKSKKAESKKSEGKTKKVASVSFLGLLFFILLFGGLVPVVNVRYGGMREAFMGRSDFVGNGFYEKHRGRVLAVNGSGYGETFSSGPGNVNCAHRGDGGGEPNSKHGGEGNGSEPLMASLYVPRNDKLVKIDGNLIIHSILASEKAMASREDPREKKSDETGLAVPGDLAPAVPVPRVGRNSGRHHHLALGSGYAEKENFKTSAADHRLHQWFREGLAGPMLSSGMCTEVFQFAVSAASAPGAIIPATSSRNVSVEHRQNSTHIISKGRNRRILHGLPIPLPASSTSNVSEENAGRDTRKGSFIGTDSASSMVVSVLMDPREAADTDGDGMMGPKSLSRIFVVVLIDSVKYVTYSCMLPFKGSGPHLVTT